VSVNVAASRAHPQLSYMGQRLRAT
jgi:hypothetical protein